MSRRAILLIFTLSLSALALSAGSATAQTGGGCQLDGTASFDPGLGISAQDFSYSFNGDLTNCQSNEAGAPGSGVVSAGEAVTIDGRQYQEPAATGNGGCTNSTTSGVAIVTWADGTQSVLEYSTSGVAAGVSLEGAVIDSVTLPAINPQPGEPTSATVTSSRYAGASSRGLLLFEPPDPTACNAPGGVSTAGISGLVTLISS